MFHADAERIINIFIEKQVSVWCAASNQMRDERHTQIAKAKQKKNTKMDFLFYLFAKEMWRLKQETNEQTNKAEKKEKRKSKTLSYREVVR